MCLVLVGDINIDAGVDGPEGGGRGRDRGRGGRGGRGAAGGVPGAFRVRNPDNKWHWVKAPLLKSIYRRLLENGRVMRVAEPRQEDVGLGDIYNL